METRQSWASTPAHLVLESVPPPHCSVTASCLRAIPKFHVSFTYTRPRTPLRVVPPPSSSGTSGGRSITQRCSMLTNLKARRVLARAAWRPAPGPARVGVRPRSVIPGTGSEAPSPRSARLLLSPPSLLRTPAFPCVSFPVSALRAQPLTFSVTGWKGL